MIETKVEVSADQNPIESSEWLEALDQVIDESGPERAGFLLELLQDRANRFGIKIPVKFKTPYVNTIPVWEERPYPGDRALERRIKSLLRYNAAAMVSRQNRGDHGIGGHISTYASLATLVEVGFNHFFRGSIDNGPGDFVYFQGHAAPGIYARAFLEGRLSTSHLDNFRHELRDSPGLSSYPHPWLMPDFWQFPTVSMGLGPINSIYHARFLKYMENRGLAAPSNRQIWAFLGDGEMDEPESTGAITLASREHCDNLIWVVNCNLQRLDGPVRGNGRIVDELESLFRGAGWNVIKVLWGDSYDPLFEKDTDGLLLKRMTETVDGEFQAYKGRGGKYIRERFFGKYPELLKLVEGMSDEQLGHLRRGGHDSLKVYNAYYRALHTKGQPTVILAKTVKGYGLGAAGESRNMAHNQKELSEEQFSEMVQRFELGIPEEKVRNFEFYRPSENEPEMQYLLERRRELGGWVPQRKVRHFDFKAPSLDAFKDTLQGTKEREVSTTMAYVGILRNLLRDKEIGKYVVPIIPDEMRTFGMESLISQVGIYASQGQLYEPVDAGQMLYYKESKQGQIFQEGITEAGSMATFTAAGTAYANLGVPMVPLFTYYSMFGFQRVGDMVWAFADSRGKGFMVGGTAGRTTLAGEGLQHQDGHSHLMASTVPTCKAYDPAYGYEIAVILQDGIKRMYEDKEECFYYVTVGNENYAHPAMPEGVEEGIIKGIYKFKAASEKAVAHLFGSGSILNEAVRAQQVLAEKYGVHVDVYSVTSPVELRREAMDVERWNRFHPDQPARTPYIQQVMEGTEGPIIAASDYMKILFDGLGPWLSGRMVALGTDGFGRSENRRHLRMHFEVDTNAIVGITLSSLARQGKFDAAKAIEALKECGLTDDKLNPAHA